MYDHAEDWSFEWDDGNESELAKHGIRPHEAEEIFLNVPRWRRDKKSSQMSVASCFNTIDKR